MGKITIGLRGGPEWKTLGYDVCEEDETSTHNRRFTVLFSVDLPCAARNLSAEEFIREAGRLIVMLRAAGNEVHPKRKACDNCNGTGEVCLTCLYWCAAASGLKTKLTQCPACDGHGTEKETSP